MQTTPKKHIEIPLTGKLMTGDPATIGTNFQTLSNMRYTDAHIQSIAGMTASNATALSSYPKVRNAFQFKKSQPVENHILVQAYNADLTASQILENTAQFPNSQRFVFNTNASAAGDGFASRSTIIATPPATFSLEIVTLFTALGTLANVDYAYLSYVTATGTGAWRLGVIFASDGLYIQKASAATGEVGTNIVKCNSTKAWQTWRFQVNKTTVASATVTVFLDDVSQGTVDCDYETGGTAGTLTYTQYGNTTNFMSSQVGGIKIGTGLGALL